LTMPPSGAGLQLFGFEGRLERLAKIVKVSKSGRMEWFIGTP
jgi:hypothetical protein